MTKRLSNPPDASALMSSARSFGNYDLTRALADLLDNSITANAHSIDITCNYNAGNPEIRVRDDGEGMSDDELRIAMRPASADPIAERAPDDLGRFGWGMKSASFSQCKMLTVVTKKQGNYAAASWDLDDIDAWNMIYYSQEEAKDMLSDPMVIDSGTELIWRKCDRLSEDGTLTADQFNALIVQARKGLSLLFHRFISGKGGAQKISLSLNSMLLDAVDPFHSDHPATQTFPSEVFPISKDMKILMTAYTLPHYSKLAQDEYETLGGEEGYVKNQGFYVYRNNRLIIYGTWFRLVKHGELSKLVRISIDIPNSLDSIWKVTIDKSDVQLPSNLRSRMRTLVDQFRDTSARVFRGKGGKIGGSSMTTVWERYVKNQQIKYKLNRSHPLLAALTDSLEVKKSNQLKQIIWLIEEQLPIDSVFGDASASPKKLNQATTEPDEFREFIRATLPIFLANRNSSSEAISLLKTTSPYGENWNEVEQLLAEWGVT